MNKSDHDEKPVLLVVDDTPQNLDVLVHLLNDQYRVKVATNGSKALKISSVDPKPDLILLDIMMPEMDGFEVCRRLQDNPNTQDIPIIFVTAMNEMGDEAKGLSLGAVDYITKPVNPPLVMARVENHLRLANQKRALEKEVKERTIELHEKNRRLEEELAHRQSLETQLEFQLRLQRAVHEMARWQLEAEGTSPAETLILRLAQDVFQAEQCALYEKRDHRWTLAAQYPEDQSAPELKEEDFSQAANPTVSGSEVCLQLDVIENMEALENEESIGAVRLWLCLPSALGFDLKEGLTIFEAEAKLLLKSAHWRASVLDSLGEF